MKTSINFTLVVIANTIILMFNFLIEQAFLAIFPRVSQSLYYFLVVINRFDLLIIYFNALS